MVLTVTLNPVLERKLFFNQIVFGSGNRSVSEVLNAGGKGINISRQLNVLGIDNIALTFAGGNNGKLFRNLIAAEKIDNALINTKSEMRYSVNAVDLKAKNVSIFFSPNNEITSSECKLFLEKYEKILTNVSTVVVSGSSPNAECEKLIPLIISKAKKLDKITIVDTYGNQLLSAIDAGPMIYHANVKEIEKSLNIDLSTENSKINFLKQLYNKGIKLAFLTDGNKDFYSSKFDFIYKISPPSITELDSTGSGDAFLSGIIYGLEKALVYADFIKMAVAIGAANAEMIETSKVSFTQYEKYLDQVQVVPIGKKMKLIDDSPTQ